MTKQQCVYKIKSKSKNIFYIGSAVHLPYRVQKHFKRLREGKHHSPKLQNHYNKYGEKDLIIEIVESVPNGENLLNREQYYIDTLKPFFNVLQTVRPIHFSKEARLKISVAGKGRVFTEEHKQKIAAATIGHTLSLESRKKLSESKRGKKLQPLSEEHKEKIRRANTGKIRSEEHCRRLSESLKGKTVSLTEEQRQNKILKLKNPSPEVIEKRILHGHSEKNKSVLEMMHERVRGKKKSPEHIAKITASRRRNKQLKVA